MRLALAVAGIAALVVALVLISRRLDPIGGDVTPDRVSRPGRTVTPSDVPGAWIGWDRDDSRATPLPRSEPVATGWRARMSRHVVSRHERGDDVAHAESPDGAPTEGDGSARVVEVAPGVHASRQSMDEWISERIGRAPYTRASLAQAAAREYRCSLRTAQRAVTRIITEQGGTK